MNGEQARVLALKQLERASGHLVCAVCGIRAAADCRAAGGRNHVVHSLDVLAGNSDGCAVDRVGVDNRLHVLAHLNAVAV
jgi:hypothetical protein